jgi:hypothetical protein
MLRIGRGVELAPIMFMASHVLSETRGYQSPVKPTVAARVAHTFFIPPNPPQFPA